MSNNLPLVFFKTIFDLLPDPVFIIDKKKLNIKLCNIETQNLLKKGNDYLFGKKLEELFSDNSVLISNIYELVKKNGTFTIKDKLRLNDHFFEIKCINSEELKNEFFIILKKVQEIDYSLNLSYFNEVFSILSHEINNPISSIKLASDLISKRYAYVDSELLDIIRSEALRIARFFSNFNLSEIKQITNKSNENIHELIRLSLFKIKQMPNKLIIIEEFDPSLPMIRISRDLIMQLLDNILVNSYEASNFKKNSYLRIQTRFVVGESIKIPNIKDQIKRNSISVTITDNGIGISKESLKKIFIPFFSTKKRGSGIGLFLVKKIIDDHEGTIAIQSSEGITKVKIILPF